MQVKDLVLSSRVAGVVMNFPLYDGSISRKARQFIADGYLDQALAEYRRLSDLGSGTAKCILAYLNLRDSPGTLRSVSAAKLLASAALISDPGYANYVLSYVAATEKNSAKAVRLMCESYKARFLPASTALGLILGQGYGVSKSPKRAEIFFWRAIKGGHIPAPMLLSRFYLRGDCGWLKRIAGLLAYPICYLYSGICTRYLIFSIYAFRHFNITIPRMFNEQKLR
jgi:TPR repeat protein